MNAYINKRRNGQNHLDDVDEELHKEQTSREIAWRKVQSTFKIAQWYASLSCSNKLSLGYKQYNTLLQPQLPRYDTTCKSDNKPRCWPPSVQFTCHNCILYSTNKGLSLLKYKHIFDVPLKLNILDFIYY